MRAPLGVMSKTFLRVTHYASRFTSSDSGFIAELLPAYSGGTVMELHHLPRHMPNLFLDPVPFVKGLLQKTASGVLGTLSSSRTHVRYGHQIPCGLAEQPFSAAPEWLKKYVKRTFPSHW